jgi:hypothetical protein
VPSTGKRVNSDYAYVMKFDSDKIGHMTKIWHAGIAMRELGWAQPQRPDPIKGLRLVGSRAGHNGHAS